MTSRDQDTGTTGRPVTGAPGAAVGLGSVLNGRFVLERLIARGGMGVVYKARDLRREEAADRDPFVAIKVIREDFKHHPDALIALEREARKAQRLAHPNIATVHDFDRDGDTVYMTMELLEGESLQARLKRVYPQAHPLAEAMAIISGMAEGLAYAHEHGIVHSDFKPGNVFLTRSGLIKILDFGIARAARSPEQPAQDATVFDPGTLGALTPAYASCEMLESAPPDPRDDIYALACVAYELLAGRHPFGKAPCIQARARQLKPHAPGCLSRRQWRGLTRGLAFQRADRTPSVADFVADLQLPTRPGLRRAAPWLLGLGLAVLVTAISLYLLRPWGGGTPTPAPQQTASPPSEPPRALSSVQRARIDDLLEVADAHLLVGRLIDPPGGNAFEVYRQVLEQDPGNRRAQAGLDQIAARLLEMAGASARQGDSDRARILVRRGLEVRPHHPGLLQLQGELGEDSMD